MKRYVVLFLLMTVILPGCAAMLPKIESQHPVGYSELVRMVPECKTTTLDNYGACLIASQMIESSSPKKATVKFITHWEETSFGEADRKQKAGESVQAFSPTSGVLHEAVWGSVKSDAMAATERIVLPVLRQIYKSSDDDYSKRLLQHLDLIVISSKSSFDSFREAHTQAFSAGLSGGSNK